MSLNILRRVDNSSGIEGMVDAKLVNLIAFNIDNAVSYPGFDSVVDEMKLRTVIDALVNYNNYIVGGTANDITLTNLSGNTELKNGMIIQFVPAYTSTTSVVISLNGGIKKNVLLYGKPLIPGAIRAGSLTTLKYDSVNGRWNLVNGSAESVKYIGNSTDYVEISSTFIRYKNRTVNNPRLIVDVNTGSLVVQNLDDTGAYLNTPARFETDGRISTLIDAVSDNHIPRLSQVNKIVNALDSYIYYTGNSTITCSTVTELFGAINSLNKKTIKSNINILLSPGTYDIAGKSLSLTSINTRSYSISVSSTTNNRADVIITDSTPGTNSVFNITRTNDVNFNSITIDSAAAGIVINKSRSIKVNDCVISNITGTGVVASKYSEIFIANSSISFCNYASVKLDYSSIGEVSTSVIESNYVLGDSNKYGILTSHKSNCSILTVDLKNLQAGIYTQFGSYSYASRITIDSCKYGNITSKGSMSIFRNFIVTDTKSIGTNVIYAMDNSYVEFSVLNTASDRNSITGYDTPFNIIDNSKVKINHTDITGCLVRAIYAGGGSNASLYNVKITDYNANNHAIYLSSSSRLYADLLSAGMASGVNSLLLQTYMNSTSRLVNFSRVVGTIGTLSVSVNSLGVCRITNSLDLTYIQAINTLTIDGIIYA